MASDDVYAKVDRKRRNYNLAIAVFTLGGALALTAVLGILVLQNAQLNNTSQILIECTTPPADRQPPVKNPGPNDCYMRSRSSTGEAVSNIGNIAVAAAACGAANPGDVVATRKCVDQALGLTK